MAVRVEKKQPKPPNQQVFNVPNLLTGSRMVLAIVLFGLLGWAQGVIASSPQLASHLYLTSMIIFIVAAATDWVDGYWARKYGQVTTLGRIFDPFVDKFIVCGTFIYLVASEGSHVTAWMATVIVARELLVTALRGYVEQQGGDFSAQMPGKLKMVLQCVAAVAALWVLTYTGETRPADWMTWTLLISLWGAIVLTLYSGVGYVFSAVRMLRQ
ncbi:MAG: CDP-diacylglycerol--glycerol-3-phosphate 3-phosphatidyltransferase [Pirellulales bacterium]